MSQPAEPLIGEKATRRLSDQVGMEMALMTPAFLVVNVLGWAAYQDRMEEWQTAEWMAHWLSGHL